jgi:hypothetical protein
MRYRKNSNASMEPEILDFAFMRSAGGLLSLPSSVRKSVVTTPVAKSYAQSLRVIGQALETLRINAFALEKKGDKYVVQDWEPSFLKSLADEVWGTGDFGQMPVPRQESGNLLIYTNSDAERLETQGRSRRSSNGNPNTYTISSGLRSVGDYLDKKGVVAFDIWWSIESVRLRFETAAGGPKETNFTLHNLQDLAVGMYLKRSNR